MDETKTGRKSLNKKGSSKAIGVTLPDDMIEFLKNKNFEECLGGLSNTIRKIIFQEIKRKEKEEE